MKKERAEALSLFSCLGLGVALLITLLGNLNLGLHGQALSNSGAAQRRSLLHGDFQNSSHISSGHGLLIQNLVGDAVNQRLVLQGLLGSLRLALFIGGVHLGNLIGGELDDLVGQGTVGDSSVEISLSHNAFSLSHTHAVGAKFFY